MQGQAFGGAWASAGQGLKFRLHAPVSHPGAAWPGGDSGEGDEEAGGRNMRRKAAKETSSALQDPAM